MRKFALMPLLCFICFNVFGQSTCDSLFFRRTATFINDAAFINDSSIIAIGTNGYIIKSTDNGRSWHNIPVDYTGIFNNFISLQFPTTKVGYATGTAGIMKTEDGGENWFLLKNVGKNNSYYYNDQSFLNKDTGFIACSNGHILSTFDGGRTFIDSAVTTNPLTSIQFINDSTGLAAGNDVLLKTNDKGKTWQQADLSPFGYYTSINKVKFITPKVALATSNHGLLKSTDSGRTWALYPPTYVGSSYIDFYFFDTSNGIILSGGGIIYITKDGGKTVTTDVDSYPAQSSSFQCITANAAGSKLMIGGGDAGGIGRSILVSADKGKSWQTQSLNTTIDFTDISLINDSSAILAGRSKLLKTNDYGESWKPLALPPSQFGNPIRLYFIDSVHGYAATEQLAYTNDGGKSWQSKTFPVDGGSISRIKMHFFDTLRGLMFVASVIYKTTDGGNSWNEVTISKINGFLMDFCIDNKGKGFAVGYNGELQVTTDFGSTWQVKDINTTDFLTSVYFFNNQLGFIGGTNNIYRTTDGGTTWNIVAPMQDSQQPITFAFSDALHGYLLSSYGGTSRIFNTANGGASWQLLQEEHENIRQLTGLKTFYVIGDQGLIEKTDHLHAASIPGYIAGPQKVCLNSTANYSIAAVDNFNYTWGLSGGGEQRKGSDADTITWTKEGKYNISVTAGNVCGVSPTRTLQVEVADFAPAITVTNDSILTVTKGDYYKWYHNDTLVKSGGADSDRVIIITLPGIYKANVLNAYGCSKFTDTVHYAGRILPLQLLSFTAQYAGKGVLLQWRTANEINVSNYIVEKSIDGLHFTALATVIANNAINNNYSTADNSPITKNIYYRLKMVDKDGAFTYSYTVVITAATQQGITVYPNPANDNIVINNGSESIKGISIYSSSGKLVYTKTLTGLVNSVSVNTVSFASGNYYVQVITVHGQHYKQFVVVH